MEQRTSKLSLFCVCHLLVGMELFLRVVSLVRLPLRKIILHCRVVIKCHGICEFICASVLQCLEGLVSLCPPLRWLLLFLPPFPQGSRSPKERDLIETYSLGLSVPKSVTLHIGCESLYLFLTASGRNLSDGSASHWTVSLAIDIQFVWHQFYKDHFFPIDGSRQPFQTQLIVRVTFDLLVLPHLYASFDYFITVTFIVSLEIEKCEFFNVFLLWSVGTTMALLNFHIF